MKIAVMAGLFAKWNMKIDASHTLELVYFANLSFSMRLKNILFLCFLFCCVQLQAQVQLTVLKSGSTEEVLLVKSIPDSSSCQAEITQFWLQSGFLAARIDSIKSSANADSLRIWISPGRNWNTLRLKINPSESDLREWFWPHIQADSSFLLDRQSWHTLRNAYLLEKQNQGFPFALLQLKNFQLDTQSVYANLISDLGPLILFDSIGLAGTAELKSNFLSNYLGLKPGQNYSEERLKLAESKLIRLPFVQQVRPYALYYYGNWAKPYFYFNKKNASSFDGFLGVAPNSAINGKLVLTGDINLKLQNLLSTGKSLQVSFRSFRAGSSDLKIQFDDPAFWRTGFGFTGNFSLLRFDSIYLDLQAGAGLSQLITKHVEWALLYAWQRVDLLNPDTGTIRLSAQLPDFSDFRLNQLSLRITRKTPGFFRLSRNVWELETEVGMGLRNLVQNPLIASMKFENENGNFYNLYETANLQSVRFKGQFQAGLQTKIFGNWIWFNQISVGALYAKQLFLNEYFRIGGLKTLRGFDEQRIFADKYAIGLSEFRYKFGQDSYFCAFYNQGMYTNISRSSTINQAPGFGLGMQAETGAGKLVFYYALGKTGNAGFNLNAARIHVGYSSLF